MWRCRLFITTCVAFCASACTTNHPRGPQTYAGLEAEVNRNSARFARSQLTQRPERNLDNSEVSFPLFFQLPLSERVVYIMASFAQVELDGADAEGMYAMLCNLDKPKIWYGTFGPGHPTTREKAYTRAIFRRIDAYPEAQVRSFCRAAFGDYARFQKNFKTWRNRCMLERP